MKAEAKKKVRQFVWRSMVGYFAPLIVLVRMLRKRKLNYWWQIRVMYRYISWK